MNNIGTSFNVTCLTKTWCSNSEIINSSYFDINNYKAIPFGRKRNKTRGSILIYVKTDLMYKLRKDLSIFDQGKEILIIEIISKESKNMLISCCYRPPKGKTENLTGYFASIFQGVQYENKKIFIIGDFNLNYLNYNEKDMNIKHFYHKLFELWFIPLIDKPTRVCRNSATIIDNILTNSVFDNTLKKTITKSDISDHFPIIFTTHKGKNQSKCQNLLYNKREFNESNKAAFKQELSLLLWWHASSQKKRE